MSRNFSPNWRSAPILIACLGLFLRLYKLGSDSFWIDEVGVANAARAATISEALHIAHNHVMSMPFDYIVAWGFARLNTSEFFLRLPSVLWGTAALIASYVVFKNLSDRRTALLTSLFLAISPIHIQYSQELRFYAALVFFYLLSTWFLIRAIEKPGTENWMLFTFFTLVGIFFHVYTLLSVTNGAAWLWITHGNDPKFSHQRKSFLRSVVFLLVAFLLGLLFFGSVYTYDIPLLLDEKSIFTVIGIGLGWVPFYSIIQILPWISGFLLLALTIIGLFQNLAKKPLDRIFVLFYSIAVQIAGITLLNFLKSYFIAPRQFLMFLPFMLFFSALGFQVLLDKTSKGIYSSRKLLPIRLDYTLLSIVLIISFPALINYYLGDKGMAREISQILAESWQPGDLVLVIPNYEVANYFYYSQVLNEEQNLLDNLYGTDWEDLPQVTMENKAIYLITPYPLAADRIKLLKSLLFEEIYIPKFPSRYTRSVWRWSPTTRFEWDDENLSRGHPQLEEAGTSQSETALYQQCGHDLQLRHYPGGVMSVVPAG